MTVPWSSAFNMRMWALLKNQFAVSIVISRDHSSARNRVVVDAQGAFRVFRVDPLRAWHAHCVILNTSIHTNVQHAQTTGWPRVHYSLTSRDRANMLHSSGVVLRMMQATGASLVMPIYDSFRTWRRGRDDDKEGLDGYIKVGRRWRDDII